MSSSKTNTKFKNKFRKENSSISKFKERVLRPDNANEVFLRRTRIYQKTVYRTSDIDKGSSKPSTGKKVESKNLLQKCELIAEIEKQLHHLQSQQKYLQMTKETEQSQSWKESLLTNQSSRNKKDLSQQGCTKKLPAVCDIDTREVCALLQVLLKKNCVKVTDSSTQIETPIKHKKINGEDYSLSYNTENVHLSSDTSSVNVLWKGGANSLTLRKGSVKMVDSTTQVGRSIEDPKHRSTQVSIKKAGLNDKVNNPIRVSKQRLGRWQHPPSSESGKSSPTFKRAEREAKEFGKSSTNRRKDYSRKKLKSYYKPIENKLEPQVKKEEHTININTTESSKSVLVLKSLEKSISLTPRTIDMPYRSPKSYLAEIEEMKASRRKTVRYDNRKVTTNSNARSKMSHLNQQILHREYKTASEYRDIQTNFKTNYPQMAPLVDLHSPIRNQISRQTLTISAQSQKDSPNKVIASQVAFIKSPTQSYKDSKHEHRVKNPNDLSRESRATPQWNSMSVRPNVIDDRTYIIPDTDRSEEYIILPYVHNPNDVELRPAKGKTNYLQSRDELSKIEKSNSVILEDASSRESYVNTSKTSRIIQNTMHDMSNTVESTQINTSMSDQFKRSNRFHYNKMGSMPFKHQARKSSNSDASLRNRSSNSGKTANKPESKRTSVSTFPQEYKVSDISRQSSQKNTSFRSHRCELKDESISSGVTHNPCVNTPTYRSNRSDTAHMSDLTDKSMTNHSYQLEMKAVSQAKLQMSKNPLKSPRKEGVINSELKKPKDMSRISESSHELQDNVSNRKTSINSELSKDEDISNEFDFIHEPQKITTSPKYENKDDLLKARIAVFKTVKSEEHLSKSEIGRKEEDTDITHQTEPKAFKSENNISTSYRKSEQPSKSDLKLKTVPNQSESITSADQSAKMTCSDRSFTLKPVALLKIYKDADDHCIRQQRNGSTLKAEGKVFVNSKISEVNDTSSEMAYVLVSPNIFNDKAETNQGHDSISEPTAITETPSEILNYIQYLQNRLKDCDEMVEKQTFCLRETFQSNEGFEVENASNFEIEQKSSSSKSLIKREGSIERLDESLDSVSKFEVSCCCSFCGEEQSTSYHSDIPPFTGCDCMKEGYYQIMRLAYGK